MIEVCPICHGLQHIYVEINGVRRLVRCRCLIKKTYKNKLDKFNLDFEPISHLVDEKGFRFSEDKDGALASKIHSIYLSGRIPKKQIILNCALSTIRVKYILSQVVASIPSKDVTIRDLADFISDSFSNVKIKLNKLTFITTLFSNSKQLKSRFIQDLMLQAHLENRIIIFVVDDLRALKQELPELAIPFATDSILVGPLNY